MLVGGLRSKHFADLEDYAKSILTSFYHVGLLPGQRLPITFEYNYQLLF